MISACVADAWVPLSDQDNRTFPDQPTNVIAHDAIDDFYIYKGMQNGSDSDIRFSSTVDFCDQLNFRSDEKVFIYRSEIGNVTDHDIAYLHTATINSPQKKGSSLASCITISAASRVDPGIVVKHENG